MDVILYSDFLIRNAAEHGSRPAVIAADASYTYEQLNRTVNRFANGLRRRGIREGDRVMAALPKNAMPIVAMLGIMKIGAVYVPVGPDYPEERVRKMQSDLKPALRIGTEAKEGRTAFGEILSESEDSEPERPRIDGSAPCMILYTSGSTGAPKGAILRHRGFIATLSPCRENLGAWALQQYGNTFLGVAWHTFSFFYIEYCMVLSTACTYIMADAEQSRNPVLMAGLMDKYGVDVVALTPSVFLQFLKVPAYAQALRQVRLVGLGGEMLPADIAETVRAHAKACRVYNLYSQTESNGTLLSKEILDRPGHSFPNRGWKLLVADEEGRETGDGETGELLMAGENMMMGYLNLPEETAKKTVVIDGVKYFRTGDYARRFSDGSYEIVGRADRMIKLRGLRIEPGEIETLIRGFPGVKIDYAAAKVCEIRRTQHLAVYYTGEGPAEEKELRAYLSHRLPGYMVPDRYCYLECFPINAGGKLDYSMLPEIRDDEHPIVPPADETEETLLSWCKSIVSFDGFGVTTPLAEAGFTSLLSTELASLVLSQMHAQLKLTDFLSGEVTVRKLAEKIRESGRNEVPPAERLDRYPLTPQQYQFVYQSPIANMYREIEFTDRWTDGAGIRAVLVRVFNSFPYLFTCFRKQEDVWYQIPHPERRLREEDIEIFGRAPSEEDEAAFFKPYDIGTAERLFDIRIFKAETVTVLLRIHHILMDHVFIEKLITYIRRSLPDPAYRIREDADYFEYTQKIWKAEAEKPSAMPELYTNTLRKEPPSVRSYAYMTARFGMETLEPVVSKYRLQTGDYMFGLLCEACLEVTGLEDLAVFYVFGGRNDAEYLGSAGFFPYRIMIPFSRDERFFEHIGRDVLRAMENSAPQHDVNYRILGKNESPFPYVSFNCLELIGENEDFILYAVSGETAPVEKSARRAIPHIDICCYIEKDTMITVQINYDPDFISEEMMRAILDRAAALSEEIRRRETPGCCVTAPEDPGGSVQSGVI